MAFAVGRTALCACGWPFPTATCQQPTANYSGGGLVVVAAADAPSLATATGGGVATPSVFVVAGAGGGGAGWTFCSVLTRMSIPFCWRLRINQRSILDSLMPMRMSLIDSYTDGSLMS